MSTENEKALARLGSLVEGFSIGDLGRLYGAAHGLRPNLTGELVVLADVLDVVGDLAVAQWAAAAGVTVEEARDLFAAARGSA